MAKQYEIEEQERKVQRLTRQLKIDAKVSEAAHNPRKRYTRDYKERCLGIEHQTAVALDEARQILHLMKSGEL